MLQVSRFLPTYVSRPCASLWRCSDLPDTSRREHTRGCRDYWDAPLWIALRLTASATGHNRHVTNSAYVCLLRYGTSGTLHVDL
jgi:hypothetical protein